MMILHYASKKELKEQVGKPLDYSETSAFGAEYKADGQFVGAGRPSVTGMGKLEFFAQITMENGLIKKVV